ncbi:MAG: hypothetical protein R2817_09340 [Flavobacteriales bacterium]
MLLCPQGLRRLFSFWLSVTLLLTACAQSSSQRSAVRMGATVTSTPPAITLNWVPESGSSSYSVFRKLPAAAAWGSAVASLSGTATTWTDTNVSVGVAYDYKVVRSGGGSATGYVRSGIALPAEEDRGTLVLLVETGLAAQLSLEIAAVEQELLSDGWWVIRHDVDADAEPSTVRAQLIADRAADPDVKAVYILGHVPVPYSGNINPDGHVEHRGAWACDAYYGDLDGTWTDATVNVPVTAYGHNRNIPGDGRFDQSDLPSAVELMVGRVDLSDLPTLPFTESQLMWYYFNKAGRWKRKELTVPATALLFDDLQWTGYPLAQSGHMSLTACVGPGQVQEVTSSVGPFVDQFGSQPGLWTFKCSTGAQSTGTNGQVTFVGTQSGVRTAQLASISAQGIFNMSFGSYYGDWDNEDNYLRALLGSGNALTHVWSGIPNWYMFPMAMGETIGHATRLSQNNTQQVFSPQNAGWQGQSVSRIHMGLMGDPTLRQVQVAPPTDLVVVPDGWYASFSWQPSPEPVLGYVIHRIDSVNGAFVRLNEELVQGTSFTSAYPFLPGDRYLVRAVSLINGPTGSFHALSLGALARVTGSALVDCNGTLGGLALPGLPCDDGNAATTNDLYTPECTCAGELTTGVGSLQDDGIMVVQRGNELVLRAERGLPARYTLRDMAGRLLRTGNLMGTGAVLSLEGMSAGLHLLQLEALDGSAVTVHRFVVER